MALKDLVTDLSNFKYTDYDNAGKNNSQIAHRHGGEFGPTPATPAHPDDHSKFDDGVGRGVHPNDEPQQFTVRGYQVTGKKRFYIGWQGDLIPREESLYGIGSFNSIASVFDYTQTRDRLRKSYDNYDLIEFGSDGSVHVGNQDLAGVVGGGLDYYGNLKPITPRGSIFRDNNGNYRVPQEGKNTNPPGGISNIPLFEGTKPESGFDRSLMYIPNHTEPLIPDFKQFTRSDSALKTYNKDTLLQIGQFDGVEGINSRVFEWPKTRPYDLVFKGVTPWAPMWTTDPVTGAKSNIDITLNSTQPYVVRNVGDRWGLYEGDPEDGGEHLSGAIEWANALSGEFLRAPLDVMIDRSVADIGRIAKFLTSTKGTLFLTKQFILQAFNPTIETKVYNPLSLGSAVPFIHVNRHAGGKKYTDVVPSDSAIESIGDLMPDTSIGPITIGGNDIINAAFNASGIEQPSFGRAEMQSPLAEVNGQRLPLDKRVALSNPNRYMWPGPMGIFVQTGTDAAIADASRIESSQDRVLKRAKEQSGGGIKDLFQKHSFNKYSSDNVYLEGKGILFVPESASPFGTLASLPISVAQATSMATDALVNWGNSLIGGENTKKSDYTPPSRGVDLESPLQKVIGEDVFSATDVVVNRDKESFGGDWWGPDRPGGRYEQFAIREIGDRKTLQIGAISNSVISVKIHSNKQDFSSNSLGSGIQISPRTTKDSEMDMLRPLEIPIFRTGVFEGMFDGPGITRSYEVYGGSSNFEKKDDGLPKVAQRLSYRLAFSDTLPIVSPIVDSRRRTETDGKLSIEYNPLSEEYPKELQIRSDNFLGDLYGLFRNSKVENSRKKYIQNDGTPTRPFIQDTLYLGHIGSISVKTTQIYGQNDITPGVSKERETKLEPEHKEAIFPSKKFGTQKHNKTSNSNNPNWHSGENEYKITKDNGYLEQLILSDNDTIKNNGMLGNIYVNNTEVFDQWPNAISSVDKGTKYQGDIFSYKDKDGGSTPVFDKDLYDKTENYLKQLKDARVGTDKEGDPTITIKTSHKTSDPNSSRLVAQDGKYKNLENIKLQDLPLINLQSGGNLGKEGQALGFVNQSGSPTKLSDNLYGPDDKISTKVGENYKRKGFTKQSYQESIKGAEQTEGGAGDTITKGRFTLNENNIPTVVKRLSTTDDNMDSGVVIGDNTQVSNIVQGIEERKESKATGKGAVLDRYKTLAYGKLPKQGADEERYDKKEDKSPVKEGDTTSLSTITIANDTDTGLGLIKKSTDNKYRTDLTDNINLHPYGDADASENDYIKFKIYDLVNRKYIIFRAFLSGIAETLTPDWGSERYIGRPDNVHVYQGVERSISFDFNVVPNSKQELPVLWEKLNYLVGLTYPTWKSIGIGQRMEAPFISLTIGDMYNDVPGFFSGLTVTVNDQSPWEIDNGFQLPHAIDVSCEFTHIGKHTLASQGKHYDLNWLKTYDNSKEWVDGNSHLGARKEEWNNFYKDISPGAI